MRTNINHNSLLKKIAKNRLYSFDIFQLGQSRTFIHDKGWYTIIIEFQPSASSQGTYLNVGTDFNFYPRDSFAFSYGYREKEFYEFKNAEQFLNLVNELCDISILRVKQIDEDFKDIPTALETIQKELLSNSWQIFDLAIIYGLAHNYLEAKKYLNKVSLEKCEHKWQFERKALADKIHNWIDEEKNFNKNMISLITEVRHLKKLPLINLDYLVLD